MIRMTASQYHCNNNNQLSSSILIVYRHRNQFAFNCLLLLLSLIVVPIASEYNNISTITTKSIDSNDSIDEFTTSYTFLNPITLVSNNANITTDSPLTTSNLSTIKLNSTSLTTDTIDTNETTDSIVTIKSTVTTTTISPNHVNLFLDGEDEVNTLPATINATNPIDSVLITDNQLTNSSISSASPSSSSPPPPPPPPPTTTIPITTTIDSNGTSKLPTKLPTIKDNETIAPPKSTVNFSNQSNHDSVTESQLATTSTIGMINGTINTDNTRSSSYNLTTMESTTDLLIDNSTVNCDHQNADHNNNQRVTIDHYEAKKFFLFTVILLSLCCLLVLIVLILVFYVFRKLTRERTIKIPQVNAANHFNRTGGGGSIEFDTIKEGHNFFNCNVNNGFESSDLNESTTQSTGYRFLDGSVVPFTDRYNDLKTSSTDTFGHPHPPHHHQQQQQLQPSLQPNQQTSLSSPSINSLPKSATITTVDTRL